MGDNDGFGDDDFIFDEDEFLPDILSADDREIMFGIAFCDSIVHRMLDMFGEESIIDLVCAADRVMGWSSEIVANRDEVDDMLLDRHGAFDQHIWAKVQDTDSWAKMRRQLYKMTRKYLAAAVDEVVRSELSHKQ